MVGCHRGVVENCTFHDGDSSFANAVQMKGGQQRNHGKPLPFLMTREDAPSTLAAAPDCHIFARSRKGSKPRTSPFRIALLSVQWRPSHSWASMDPRYTTTHFTGPPDGSSVFCRKTKDPISPPCRKGIFSNNIIAFQTDELASTINIGSGTDPKSFKFSKNFWYCPQSSWHHATSGGNYQRAKQKASIGHDPKFSDSKKGDFRLAPGSPARDFGPRAIPKENAPVDAGN